MFLPLDLAHLRFGRMTHVPGTAVQSPEELVQCLCLPTGRDVLFRHQHFRLGHWLHWLLLETFWAVLAEV